MERLRVISKGLSTVISVLQIFCEYCHISILGTAVLDRTEIMGLPEAA